MEIKSTLACRLQRSATKHLRSHRGDCWGLAEQTEEILSHFPDLTHFFTITNQYMWDRSETGLEDDYVAAAGGSFFLMKKLPIPSKHLIYYSVYTDEQKKMCIKHQMNA